MELNLPSILTDAQVATFAATIALLVGIGQQLSPIPLPEGSKARAWAVAVLSGLFVALVAPGAGLEGVNLAMGVVLSFTALAAASLGLNRGGSYAINAVKGPATGDAS